MNDDQEDDEGNKGDFHGPHLEPPRLPIFGATNFA
jgi:hypothetical protein